VSIELQHTDGTTAVAPTRFALGQLASHYKIPMTYVDRMTQAGAGPLLARNLAYCFAEQPSTRLLRTRTATLESYAHFYHADTVRWTTTSSPKP
jgi:hypothetical protein